MIAIDRRTKPERNCRILEMHMAEKEKLWKSISTPAEDDSNWPEDKTRAQLLHWGDAYRWKREKQVTAIDQMTKPEGNCRIEEMHMAEKDMKKRHGRIHFNLQGMRVGRGNEAKFPICDR